MSLKEYDVVRLRRAPPDLAVRVGMVGAVVFVHQGGKAYEVEFLDDGGTTVAVLTLEDADLEKLSDSVGNVKDDAQ